MVQSFRQPEIIEIARREGKVTVERLSEHFGVTLQTIRRDLSELADSGKLERVHGGAILPSGTANIGYEERRGLNQAAKVDIARACAAELPENCSIFLNIGTTTANILAGNPHCQVIVTGGALRRSDGGLTGDLTVETIRRFKFDHAVIGCSALDQEGDILDFDIQEVGVSRTIIRQSRQVFLVADHAKFQRNAPARIGSLSEVDVFFTDRPVPPALQDACEGWETQVRVCGG